MRKNEVIKAIQRGDLLDALWKAANIIEHDLHCWETIREKAGDNLYIYHFATGRVESLRIDCDQIYEAVHAELAERPAETIYEPKPNEQGGVSR